MAAALFLPASAAMFPGVAAARFPVLAGGLLASGPGRGGEREGEAVQVPEVLLEGPLQEGTGGIRGERGPAHAGRPPVLRFYPICTCERRN